MNDWLHGGIDGWMHESMDKYMGEWVNGWIDKGIVGSKYIWIGMDACVDRFIMNGAH